jgi:PleD family two-component response regulator
MVNSRKAKNSRSSEPRILLASDSANKGGSMRRLLENVGFQVEYAGDYSRLDEALHAQDFDAILLEVTGEHAVEAAVAAALRVKRANARQFVGYLADPALHASGLAGDGIFPRTAVRLSATLRGLLAIGDGLDS